MDFIGDLKNAVDAAVKSILEETGNSGVSCEIRIEIPKNKEFGDYSSNAAMQLARALKMNPMKIAEDIVNKIVKPEFLEFMNVVKPGFVNFGIKKTASITFLTQIAKEKQDYGKLELGKGKKVLIEFVSANPTGPLHIGHVRNAIVGEAIARILTAGGYDVTREYYFNDAGVQMQNLGRSMRARYLQKIGENIEFPEDGYHGGYMIELAEKLAEKVGDSWKNKEDNQDFINFAAEILMENIKRDLELIDIKFDSWINESEMHKKGEVLAAVEALKKCGMVYENEGALWLKTTQFGDEKDRVVIKSDGNPTYLAPDIAYHKNKFDRGYDLIINIFGQDHHAYPPRLKTAMGAMGYDSDKLKCILYQLVTVLRDGQPMRLSKRAGEIITLRDMVQELSADVVKFFLNMRSPDSQMNFDWNLAKSHSEDNPVFFVQYAHARICSLFRKAAENGIKWESVESSNLARLEMAEEQDLIKFMAQFPDTVKTAVTQLEPHHITMYAISLAQLFNQYYSQGTKDKSYRTIVADDLELTLARLSLAHCIRTVIANALHILGITAQEEM